MQGLSTDGRTPLEKLRRTQLYTLADAYKITYPKDAPATLLRPILAASDIDPTAPLPNGEELMMTVYVDQQDGTTLPVVVEKRKVHASMRMGVNSQAELANRIAVEEANEENVDLKKQVEDLTKMVARLLDNPKAVTKPNPNKKPTFFEFKKQCAEKGVDVLKTDTRIDLNRKLKELEN